MADPTLELLHSLRDARQYTRKEGVPIWVPHTRVVPTPGGGKKTIKVEESDLQAYADDINRRERERGVVGRITDGHVKPGEPPPKLLGFYREARVGRFGPGDTPAVLVDCYYRNECLGVVRERPYRSPEVYTEDKSIKGLALLLADPYLDMGTVTYGAVARPVCYGGEHMPGYGAMGAANAGLPGGKDAEGGKDAATGSEHPHKDAQKESEDFKPEHKELFEMMRRYMKKCYELHEDWPKAEKKAEAEEEHEQGDGKEHTDPAMKKPEGVTPMEKGLTPELYERKLAELRTDYDAKLNELRGQMAAEKQALALERDHAACLTLLTTGLVGYQLSPEEKTRELGKLVKTPAAEREERMKELRVLYAERKVPEGRLELYGGLLEGGEPDPQDPFGKPWYHDAAMAYMHANPGTLYQKAIDHVKATAARK